jgi:CheY-like chemotaxis protein
MAVTRFLRQMGFDAIVVDNEIEALEAIEHAVDAPFAAILMDLYMPRMDGCDATRLIREREGEMGVEAVPILAVTASVLGEDRDRALSAGMDALALFGPPLRNTPRRTA